MAHPIHSVYNGFRCASYLGPRIWEITPPPPEIKEIQSLAGFKGKKKEMET